jgi:hypothetical protein
MIHKTFCHFLVRILVAGLVIAGGAASAAEIRKDVGPVIPDGSTRALGADTQASSSWDDWYWRGKLHNMSQHCDGPATVICSFSLGKSVTTSYSTLTGTSISSGYGIAISGFGAQYIRETNESHQRTTIKTDTFTNGVTYAGGYFCNPIKAVSRRWKRGSFVNALFRTGAFVLNRQYAIYEWQPKKHGAWSGNVAEFHYITFQIAKQI